MITRTLAFMIIFISIDLAYVLREAYLEGYWLLWILEDI